MAISRGIEIRPAEQGDLPRLKEIWRLCFGDSGEYIDLYIAHRYRAEETLLLVDGEEIAAMLTMLPVRITTSQGEKVSATMLYAIATHPEYRNRGYAAKVMEHAQDLLKNKGSCYLTLVPSDSDLFTFYRRRGYEEGFYLREALLNYEQLGIFRSGKPDCQVSAISPGEYGRLRGEQLCRQLHVSYSTEDIAYQKKISQQSGGDIYSIELDGVRGVAVVERVNQDLILIKELLIADEFMPGALAGLVQLLPAKKYILRTPTFLDGGWAGEVRPFGMVKRISGVDIFDQTGNAGYLGLAFD